MYLIMLNDEEKELFLELAYQIAFSDGSFSEEEKNIIGEYCKEMSIPVIDRKGLSIDAILDRFSQISSAQTKKIIVFEALGLVLVDQIYHENEKRIIDLMVEKFGMKEEFVTECEVVIKDYISLQSRLNHFMFD